MALHDYECSRCGHVLRDVSVPMAIGGRAGAPPCPQGCLTSLPASPGEPATVVAQRMTWLPSRFSVDAYEPFQEFMTTDTYGKPVLIDSQRKLRQVEDESRREYASNPGNAQLLNWRDYSNDTSNADASSIAKHQDRSMDDQEGPRLEADPKFAKAVLTEASAEQAAGEDVPFSGGDILGESA